MHKSTATASGFIISLKRSDSVGQNKRLLGQNLREVKP